MGQDDGSYSPVSISFKVNLSGNTFSHNYEVSCDFKRVCGQMLYCLPPTLLGFFNIFFLVSNSQISYTLMLRACCY